MYELLVKVNNESTVLAFNHEGPQVCRKAGVRRTPPIAFIVLVFAYAREGRLKGGSGKLVFMECTLGPWPCAHFPHSEAGPIPLGPSQDPL